MSIKNEIRTTESCSSSTTSPSSTVYSPQKTEDSNHEVETISNNNVIIPITVNNTFLAPGVASLEIEPSMSPLSEILQQIEDNSSSELPEATNRTLNSDHFNEVQKLIRSFEDVEKKSQTTCNGKSNLLFKFVIISNTNLI